MAFVHKSLAAVGLLGLLSLGACATDAGAGGPPAPIAAASYQNTTVYDAGGQPYAGAELVRGVDVRGGAQFVQAARLTPPESVDGLLSSPPNDARPGECYAKVVVPGQPIGAPPPQPHAVWVQSPPRPGQVSPTWCIVYEASAPQPVQWTPERYGWIRVICDKDATVDRIRHIQQRLHAWGYYDGAYEGRYDEGTAHAVAQFQERRHIEHGGVLSIKTIDALDDTPPPPPPVAPQTLVSPVYQQPYPSTFGGCGQPACGQPVYQPPIYQQPVYQQPVVQQPVIIRQPVIQQQVIQQPVYQQQIIRQPVIVQQPVVVQQPVMAACGQPACAQPYPQPCGGQACAQSASYGWGGGPQGYAPQGYGQPQGYGPTPAYRGGFLNWPGKTTY